jgi:2,4-dienoyl-CoA reductase-like NADH-dependent reductase (Old Yellow Enzyme family)
MNVTQPLLHPDRAGDLPLANRIVMAPLTRSRATDPDLAQLPHCSWPPMTAVSWPAPN